MNESQRQTPAYRIETPRTVIRCYQPTDATRMAETISASRDNLRQSHAWTLSEPESVDEKASRLRKMRGKFDLDEDYAYGIFNKDETVLLGSTGLHPRVGPNAFEIGYWIHVDYLNQGLASEATQALCVVAFEVCNVARIEIRCDPENGASARIPNKLGFIHEATLRARRTMPTGESQDTMIWTLFAKDYDPQRFGANKIRSYDVRGNTC